MNDTQIKRWVIEVRGRRFGFERSTVYADGRRYLDRWILYFGWTLRLHRFSQGDEARAPHDHPWWFITFPLSTYHEVVHDGERVPYCQAVRPFRFHYRPPLYRHRVLPMDKPVWTIVLTGFAQTHGRSALWGFYPRHNKFVPYNEWSSYADHTTDR